MTKPLRFCTHCIIFILPLALAAQLDRQALPPEPQWAHQPDWLLDNQPYKAGLFKTGHPAEIALSNGLIRRVFRLSPNAATVAFDHLVNGQSLLRGVKPEAEVTVDGVTYPVGGLIGQPNYAFLRPEWVNQLRDTSQSLQYTGIRTGPASAPFEWKQTRHVSSGQAWPPKGVHLELDFAPRDGKTWLVTLHYELYDGLPVTAKWLTLKNQGNAPIRLQSFTSELLALVEYGSTVEAREYNVPPPNLHVETDYAFASMIAEDANHHVVHWEPDPDYATQVNYLRTTPCLLKVSPELGPDQLIAPGEDFQSFRTFLLPFDGFDRERNGLAQRRMYRYLAPWTNENPLMMHARFADWERVKTAIDQCAEVGFEMVILTFGSGFNIEDESPEYLAQMKSYADYARSKGVEIGGYSLLASRSIDTANDVVMPEGQTPVFGHSPCIESRWGQDYFRKLYQFYEKSGFTLLEHDGSYPGDICASTQHPGHRSLEDSRWNQYQTISNFYRWCRSKGIYLNIPDYYYMTGGNKCAMGYREVNWSLPREQQVIHTRQNIYDGTWTKNGSMGWMFVPLTEYHGGGAAATIEPLHEHREHYESMLMSNLSAGVQACYRGPRLYDTPETKTMVQQAVSWYKQHRDVLEGDLIHLRRADGRELDYWLMVNPNGMEKAALMVFNPLDKPVQKTLTIPLYYAGLNKKVKVSDEHGKTISYRLDRKYQIEISVNVPPGGKCAYFMK